jgi:hypothetical protein
VRPGSQPCAPLPTRSFFTLFVPAIRGLEDDQAAFYYDLMYNSMNEAARLALEEMMKGYEYQSDYAKKYVQMTTQVRTQARAEEAARNLLAVFKARGMAVPEPIRERILAQADPEQLERWLDRAVVAASIAEIFDEPS